MNRSILIVEPDLEREKQIIRLLIQAGYDAVVTSDADETLRQLYQAQPDAVILSDRLPAGELDRLSDAVTTMSGPPMIELIEDVPLATAAQRPARSTRFRDLLRTLNELLEPAERHDQCKPL